MELGDKIKIKYNPSAPENSTDILAPNIKNLVLFLAFGTIFITIGFFLSGTWALTCKIRHKGEMKKMKFFHLKNISTPIKRTRIAKI